MRSWYALYTKRFKEFQVADVLRSRGIEVYLPTIRVWRSRRRREEEEPFFPCYLFARFDLNEVGPSAVMWTPGLRRVVGFDGEWTVIPDEVIEYIKARVEHIREYGYGRLTKGDRVLIVKGPLKGLEAVFEAPLPASHRVRILIEFLGSLRRCEVPVDWIEKLKV